MSPLSNFHFGISCSLSTSFVRYERLKDVSEACHIFSDNAHRITSFKAFLRRLLYVMDD